VDLDGGKDVLGIWVGENESAKFWGTVLNGLKTRGVEDIFILCTDNLTGFSAAIEAVYPKHNCIVHQLAQLQQIRLLQGFEGAHDRPENRLRRRG